MIQTPILPGGFHAEAGPVTVGSGLGRGVTWPGCPRGHQQFPVQGEKYFKSSSELKDLDHEYLNVDTTSQIFSFPFDNKN